MVFEGKSVLITGGAGFIGSHLVASLVSAGAHVTVVDNFSTGRLILLQPVLPEIALVVGDVADGLRFGRVKLEEYEYVFHLAANPYIPPSVENPSMDFHANALNTFALLEGLRRVAKTARLVNVSSGAVYGNPLHLPIQETDPTVPISPYGVSKLAAERYVAVYSQLYGIRSTSLRLFSVYGPHQRKQVVYDLLCRLRANPRRLEVLGDGSQARDFTYVRDVVQAMLIAATKAPGQGEAYNVASGTSHTIAELVGCLTSLLGLAPEVVYSGGARPGDAEKWVVDITRLKHLGFKAGTFLEEGLAAVLDWYRTEGDAGDFRT